MSALRSPSGDPVREPRGVPPLLLGLTLTLLAARLILAANLHLTEDEAYYRLWSMAPAFGYYDHPPMIAWWIAIGRRLVGDCPLGVRLIPIFGSAATSLLVFALASLAGASRVIAERAGLWFNAMPLPLAGGFLAVPDAPAGLFWILALVFALRAVRDGSWPWWAAAGVAAGLATLSKYSAIFLAPGTVIWLCLTAEGRRAFRTPGPWLAALIAIGLFSFNVAWNAEHHWPTFQKQFGRVAVHRLAPRYVLELVAAQIGLLNPAIVALTLGALAARRVAQGAGRVITPLVATSAPFGAYLLVHSLHDRVEAHWPAPIYPALAVVAAVITDGLLQRPPWRRLGPPAPHVVAIAAACTAAVMAVMSVGPASNMFAPIRGWGGFAAEIERTRQSAGAAWVGTMSYGLTAQLAGETGLHAPILQIHERERYAGLTLARPDMERGGLVVDLPRRLNSLQLDHCFYDVRDLGVIVRGAGPEAGTPYAAFRVARPRRDILRDGC